MKIIAAAGGSGGHCYPAIAFFQACRKRHPGWNLTLAVDRGAKTLGLEVEASAADAVREVESVRFAGGKSFLDPGFWGALVRGRRQARALLADIRPDLVVGFGGYGSFPVVWEAGSLRIPVIIHEQNAVMGLANRVLKGRASRLAVSLPLSEPPYRGGSGGGAGGSRGLRDRVTRTGFPLRSTLCRMDAAEARRRFNLDPALKTLLVFGGSQGSRFINGLMDDMIAKHGPELAGKWQILHLTGRAAANTSSGTAPDDDMLTGPYRRRSYSREMAVLYTAADLVVCRAGSATLHELSYFGKPAVLIPYPHARAHQVHNARVLSGGGAAWLLEEKDASSDALKSILDRAAADPARLEGMGRVCSSLLQTGGADALVDLAEEFVR